MECKKYQKMISVSIDGELSATEERELQKHLNTCAECEEYAEALMDLKAQMSHWEEADFPRDLESLLMSKIEEPKFKKDLRPGKSVRYYEIPRPLVWAAVILIIVLALNTAIGIFSKNNFESTDKYSHGTTASKITIDANDIVSYTTFGNIKDWEGRIR